jgi:ABC-type lipoprotein export system ATPase subunit
MEMNRADAVFDMKEIARAEKTVMHCVERGGWIAVTGPVGSGKSTLIRNPKS